MLRIGVLGIGAMGQHHVRIFSALDGVKLVGVCDLNKERAESIAKHYNTKAYTDYKEMLAEGLDAVSIAVPTIYHHKTTLDALDAGAHVLVEKPIAHTVEAAKEMEAKAREKKLKLMVGHIERFNPVIQELKKILVKGTIGGIVAMSARRVGPFTNRVKDVGVIIDVCVHDIDLMSYLLEDTVTGTYAIAGDSGGTLETYAQMLLKFKDGGIGIIEANRLTPEKIRQLTVTGTNGVALIDYIDQTITVQNGKTSTLEIVKSEPLKNEIEHFIDCVKNDKRPLVNGVEGMHALEVALAATESYKNKRFEEVAHHYLANKEGLELEQT